MELQRELLPNNKTANEAVTENVHTAPSYSFATYCEAKEEEKKKKYFQEEFQLEQCRHEIFGPDNGCSKCQGTGWMPVSKSNMEEPLRSLWVQAEVDSPAEDGFHLVPCPHCSPMTEELDEHIVKKGAQFELKSAKSGKNLGTYKSKAGAVKREREVEYFKHLHEETPNAMPQWETPKPLPWRLHEADAVLPGSPSKKDVSELGEDILPSEHNKQQSQKKKDQKKAAETKKDPNETEQDRKEKAKDTRKEKERLRQSKKLLPYEYTDQKDADRSAGHLGIHGSHTTGNGVYKPGSSDYSLRDAVAKKKSKQKMRGKFAEETNSHDAYPLDKANLPEDRDYMNSENPKTDGDKMAEDVMQKIKECVFWKRM